MSGKKFPWLLIYILFLLQGIQSAQKETQPKNVQEVKAATVTFEGDQQKAQMRRLGPRRSGEGM